MKILQGNFSDTIFCDAIANIYNEWCWKFSSQYVAKPYVKILNVYIYFIILLRYVEVTKKLENLKKQASHTTSKMSFKHLLCALEISFLA